MDKDKELAVKVTRLRRRLSVENEGAQSPATPSTPTKKRATKLAKPALELIDENVTENVPKRATRKSIARDAVEPADEKAVTPSRRSARIRSNTSLVIEASQNAVESPRARRATRRNSQIGSDTETATTPARQNRRTRKDSTSSVEKLAVPDIKVTVQVTEVITEEPEKEIAKDSYVENSNNQSPTVRKSPRLSKKGNKSIDEAIKCINEKLEEKDNSLTITSRVPDGSPGATVTTPNIKTNDKSGSKLKTKDSGKEDLSLTSANLINEIETKPKRLSVFSKTTTEIEEISKEKTNRKRTKSWTTITSHVPTAGDDKTQSGSGDGLLKNEIFDVKSPNRSIGISALVSNTSIENKENINYIKSLDVIDAGDTLKFLEKTPSKNIQSVVIMEDSDSNSGSIGKLTIDLENEGQHNNGDDQCVPIVNQSIPNRSVSESFSVEPMDIDETIPGNVTINDFSDKTNSSREEDKVPDSKRKSSISDQKLIESSNKPKRTSSISLQQESNNSKQRSSVGSSEEFSNDSKDALNKLKKSSVVNNSQRKSSTSIQVENSQNFSENGNKSKTNSSLSKVNTENDKQRLSDSFHVEDNETVNMSKNNSVSKTEEQNLEKTSNENKSTLVLSQLKDVSENEISNVSRSHTDTNNELSKSVNVLAKETDQKNLSLNVMTSTPLQQKSLQKIAIQMNTSIISPNAANKKTSNANKTKSPKKKVSDNSDLSSDEDLSVKSKLIDDEAEEASENYESGDSRNYEDKQYEIEHEILEKGETLESEQDFSDDSDYEKDSFIVSSDEEDNGLLSGSGDDLSLSDNELKMTTRSKKKFDERKRKEQKKASKEMYQARHNLDESDKNSKVKKSKRRRLDSSVLESEKGEEVQPKKKKRLRIDSSQDISLNNSNEDKSIRVKKRKVKRLSESVCEENDVNEKEITIFNQSVNDKNDPLSVAVKLEPKTPQKELNMSAVFINDNIEEVQINANASIMKSNETSDPLQATLVQESDESDSDISENMEIKENYDSVLETLNKTSNKQKKIKTVDTSLNLDKRTKNKVKEPTVVDQLNLTTIKKSKKKKAQVVEDSKITEEPQSSKYNEVAAKVDDSETSDSIDMRLLFPEDSNDSEANASKFKTDEKQIEEPEEQYIPLKRTEAKTNLCDSMVTDEPENMDVSFFIDTKGNCEEEMDISAQSKAKKQKKKHQESLSVDEDQKQSNAGETLAESTGFEDALVNVSSKSEKKNKKKNKSFNISQTGEEPIESSEVLTKNENNADISITVPEQTLVNVSLKSEKKKKKKDKSFDVSQIVTVEPENTDVSFFIDTKGNCEEDMDISAQSKAKKQKKKHQESLSVDEDQKQADAGETLAESTGIEYAPVNVSQKSEKKKKKRNKSFNVSETGEEPIGPSEVSSKNEKNDDMSIITVPEEALVNISLKSEKKKKKKNQSFDVSQIGEETIQPPSEMPIKMAEETPVNVSLKSNKKKKKNDSFDVSAVMNNTVPEELSVSITSNTEKKRKKRNKSLDASQIVDNTVSEEPALNLSANSDKKKKKKNKSHEISPTEVNTEYEETGVDVSANSDKKKKKNKSLEISPTDVNTVLEETENVSEKSEKKKKKKSKSHDFSQRVDKTGEESDEPPLEVSFKSEKYDVNNPEPVEVDNTLTSSKNKFKKKKKKDKIAGQPQSDKTVNTEEERKSKKRKREELSTPATEAADEHAKKKSKKRKAPEDENNQKKSKVFKENSFDKIHVPRLPESIVNQLGDQQPKESQKQKKVKAISTVPFKVEDAKRRKNKPSNYLEQSIYLNDSPVKQKQKSSLEKPKVLPFIPTAITSGKGYTSEFRINVLPQETEFIAQPSDMTNFKNEYLANQRIKKLRTFERFKRQRNHKLSKF